VFTLLAKDADHLLPALKDGDITNLSFQYGTDLNDPNLVPPPSSTPVPEPSTVIAGMLLLLPFGASTLRVLRKNRA